MMKSQLNAETRRAGDKAAVIFSVAVFTALLAASVLGLMYGPQAFFLVSGFAALFASWTGILIVNSGWDSGRFDRLTGVSWIRVRKRVRGDTVAALWGGLTLAYFFSAMIIPAVVLPTRTPLESAAEAGNLAEVQRLVESGANVNEDTGGGWSPLARALTAVGDPVDDAHVQTAEYLIEHGAAANGAIDTMELGVQSGRLDLIKFMAEHGVKPVSLVGLFYPSGYQKEVTSSKLEIADYLLAQGANIDDVSHSGVTALQLAAYYRDTDLVQYLLDKGANVEVPAGELKGNISKLGLQISPGDTALKIAESQQQRRESRDFLTVYVRGAVPPSEEIAALLRGSGRQ